MNFKLFTPVYGYLAHQFTVTQTTANDMLM